MEIESGREVEAPDEKVATRAMVADGDPLNVSFLEGILAARGFDVVTAGDGEETMCIVAEAFAARGGSGFDIALLGSTISGSSGREICQNLRSNPATRYLPVLMIAPLGADAEKARALEAGADEILTTPVDESELLARVRSVLRTKQLQQKILESARTLAARNEELVALRDRMSTLSRMFVHDLRGPLTGIMGLTQLLKARLGSDRQEASGLAERVLASSQVMQEMLSDVLDVTLLEEGSLPMRLERIGLHRAASLVLCDYKPQAEARGVQLEIQPDPEDGDCPEVEVEADCGLLLRVIGNLVFSALKHTPQGGTIRIAIGRPRSGRVVVHVTDHAEEITPESCGMPFEKGVVAAGTGLGPGINHGLSLTFCRKAVEALGGRIWVESNAAGGNNFGFVLPLEQSPP